MAVESVIGEEQKEMTIGFEPILENSLGYINAPSISLEAKITPQATPYTLIMTTFEPREESTFIFTLWYKKSQGTI